MDDVSVLLVAPVLELVVAGVVCWSAVELSEPLVLGVVDAVLLCAVFVLLLMFELMFVFDVFEVLLEGIVLEPLVELPVVPDRPNEPDELVFAAEVSVLGLEVLAALVLLVFEFALTLVFWLTLVS